MAFQKNVGLTLPKWTQGDHVGKNPVIYFPRNFLAGGTVKVGGFVWRDTTNPETEVVAAGSGAPLGFIERIIDNQLACGSEGSLDIAEGGNVTVSLRGDFAIVADASVSIGDIVYAKSASGEATFSSSSAVDTGFRAVTSGASGDMIVISNMMQSVVGVLPVSAGGTGLNALGTAGQIMKVNAGATALEWASDATT